MCGARISEERFSEIQSQRSRGRPRKHRGTEKAREIARMGGLARASKPLPQTPDAKAQEARLYHHNYYIANKEQIKARRAARDAEVGNGAEPKPKARNGRA
jgi:stress-induced acidophilic repeat protein